MNNSMRICPLVLAILLAGQGLATAAINEVGDLNIIDDPGNPSDGLRYLDMSYSDGLTLAAALSNAQVVYSNARLATPEEIDDLYAAAGLSYNASLKASDGFNAGPPMTVSGGSNYNSNVRTVLGDTNATGIHLWTDPDGDNTAGSTRDLIRDFLSSKLFISQTADTPPSSGAGWLLVSETVTPVDPEPLGLKVDAIDALDALLTGDKKTDKRLEHAIEHLIKSVEPDLWEDDSHLTDKGKKVFSEEKKAVKHLMDEQKHKKSVFADPELQAVIDTLVEADRQLAMTAVDEAMDAEGDCKKILDANKEFIKALHELAKGKFDKAIKHYGHAWEKAEKSLL